MNAYKDINRRLSEAYRIISDMADTLLELEKMLIELDEDKKRMQKSNFNQDAINFYIETEYRKIIDFLKLGKKIRRFNKLI